MRSHHSVAETDRRAAASCLRVGQWAQLAAATGDAYRVDMPYPGRPTLNVLQEFVGTAVIKQTPEQRARLLSFCAEQ